MELEKVIMNEIATLNLGGAVVTNVSFMGDGTVINFDIGALKIVFLIKDDVIAQTNSAMNTGAPITDSAALQQVNQWANYVYSLALPVVKKHRVESQAQVPPVIPPMQTEQPVASYSVPQMQTEQPVANQSVPQMQQEQQPNPEQQPHAQIPQMQPHDQIPQMQPPEAVVPEDDAQAKYEALLKQMEAMKENMAAATEGTSKKSKPADDEEDEEEEVSTKKKILSFVGNVLFYVILIVVVAGVALFGLQEEGAPPRNIGGYSVMTVLTGSMYPELPIGTLLVMGPVADNEVQVGDIITFIRNDRRTITHRVVEVHPDHHQGRPGFTTRGDAVATNDPEIVRAENVIGQILWSNYFLGQTVVFIQQNVMMVVMGAVMIGALVFVVKKFFLAPADDDDEDDDEEDEYEDDDDEDEEDTRKSRKGRRR